MAKAPATAKKNSIATATTDNEVLDGIRPGAGAKRQHTRLICPYGPPGTRKTTAVGLVAKVAKGMKWIISDPNCVPTLDVEDLMVPDKDFYELQSIAEAHDLVNEMLDAFETGKLKIPAVAIDSVTSFADWLAVDVARAHGSKYMGENPKDNGWQDLNAQMGSFIDALANLAQYTNVFAICHSREKADPKRGDYHGLNLSPQMATKLGRVANWTPYHVIKSELVGDSKIAESDFTQIEDTPDGQIAVTCQVHFRPVGLWTVKANVRNLDAVEPADYGKILRKEGLL